MLNKWTVGLLALSYTILENLNKFVYEEEQYILMFKSKGQETSYVKGHVVNILGFAGRTVSVAAIQLCC